jgi:hypothetical protein
MYKQGLAINKRLACEDAAQQRGAEDINPKRL